MKLLATILLLAAGCGTTDLAKHQTDGFNHQALLTLVGFTGSVVKIEKRFAGYTKSAHRVSLIDPAGEREVWGRQVDKDYDAATPLPDFSGIALLSGGTLTLVGPGGERAFAAPDFTLGYVGRAREAAAYAGVSADGKQLHVVRALSTGAFQEETFVTPFEDEGGWAQAPDKQPPLAVALFSGDGNRLVFFRPADGRYSYYEAADAASPLKLVLGSTCKGDGVGTPDNATYRTIAFDDALGVVFTGDRHGHLAAFDPRQPCVPAAARPAVTVGDGRPLTDVNVFGPGRLAVTQVGARLHLVTFADAAFGTPDSYANLCPYPLGALPAGTDRLAVVCFNTSDFDPTLETRDAPAVITYDGAYVLMVSQATRQSVLKIDIDVEKAAGMAIDAEQGRILTLKDSALGVLEITSLLDGGVRTKKGLFLSGILN